MYTPTGGGIYRDGKSNWYHFDQSRFRKGLHAYQGAVYLEETTEQDYCFRVWPTSFKYHEEFCENFADVAEDDWHCLTPEHLEWYRSKGLSEHFVPVPKGGIVLWDSRTIHDNCKPQKGRAHNDRWRYVVFTCMTPAIWAGDIDLQLRVECFKTLVSMCHWPSQGVNLFPSTAEEPETRELSFRHIVEKQPSITEKDDVRLLVGLDTYNFSDGQPNDPGWRPEWTGDIYIQ